MKFSEVFTVVSRTPGTVSISGPPFPAELTCGETRQMAAHMLRICDAIDSADLKLKEMIQSQTRKRHES